MLYCFFDIMIITETLKSLEAILCLYSIGSYEREAEYKNNQTLKIYRNYKK